MLTNGESTPSVTLREMTNFYMATLLLKQQTLEKRMTPILKRGYMQVLQ